MALNNLGYEDVDVVQIPWAAGVPGSRRKF